MKDVLTCIEHQSIPVISERSAGLSGLTETEARELERRQAILPANAFTWGHNSVKWTQYCGVIQLKSVTIEILPKIYGNEENRGESRGVLIQMLKKARFLKTQTGTHANINLQKHTMLDIFILHFCEELHTLLTQGLLREYIEKEDNLGVLKGRLIIESQLKHNLVHKERLYCRYDELHEDIKINRIIKFTLNLLFHKAKALPLKKLINELLASFDTVSHSPINNSDLESVIIDRNNERFSGILQQCKMFIHGFNPDVLAGRGKAFSMLFDMNALFESWVAATLRPQAWQKNLKLQTQGPRRYFAQWADTEKDVYQMRPDISLLDEDGSVAMIGDAKWKLLNQEEAKMGVSQADLYQMQAYANRYNTRSLKLYYPKQEGLTRSRMLQILGTHQTRLEIVPIDIKHDESNKALLKL